MIEKKWDNLHVSIKEYKIGFVTDDLNFEGLPPVVKIIPGCSKDPVSYEPAGEVSFKESSRNTFAGPAKEYTWKWSDNRGYIFSWTVGMLENIESITLKGSFFNGSNQPIRLNEFVLCHTNEDAFICKGDPEKWWLSTLTHTTRVGSLKDVLSSINEDTISMWKGFNLPVPFELPKNERYNDGRWRIYNDFLTLYTNSGTCGVAIGPVGVPEADIRFDCKVNNGKMRMDIVCEMNDVLIEPGQSRNSQEVAIITGHYQPALETILRWIASTHGHRTHKAPAFGWCSWYDLGQNITEKSIMDTINAFAEIKESITPYVIQIDDGYQKQVGDWECNEKFPNGWGGIVEKIHNIGAIAGIWLAPLAVHESTGLVEKHPGWFQRDDRGELLGEVNNWGPRSRWLDPTHPDVQNFIREIIRKKKSEGFNYFKIDFNTIADNCRFYNTYKTRLQAYRDLYRLYREEMGEDTYLLSCTGFTRGTVGYADASRIGPDSSAIWCALHPCTILESIRAVGMNAIANGIFFVNDPDVTYLKTRGNFDPIKGETEQENGHQGLTLNELRTWHGFVGLLGGLALISEPLQKQEFMSEIRMLEILCPPAPERGVPLQPGTDHNHRQFGFCAARSWGAFASVLLWNPRDEYDDIKLDITNLEIYGNKFYTWSFWDEKFMGIVDSGFTAHKLAPHGSMLLRFTSMPVKDDLPVLIGSNLHISMGAAEIDDVAMLNSSMTIRLNDAGARDGNLYIYSKSKINRGNAIGCRLLSLEEVDDCVWKVVLEGRERGVGQIIRLNIG